MKLAFTRKVRTGKRKFSVLEKKQLHQQHSKSQVIKAMKPGSLEVPDCAIKSE